MRKAHLFFPENDLALARDLARYTAPPAAVRLRKAGAALPLWYGADGDCFVAQGVDASWLDSVKGRFGIDIDVFDYRPELYSPVPWGWSKASRTYFESLGFGRQALPDDSRLEALRMLSHRRTASDIARRIAAKLPFAVAPAAEELFSEGEVREFVGRRGRAVLKLPWSSSGRGIVSVEASTLDAQLPMLRGMLRRQESVTAEPRYDKKLDFAMLFTMDGGSCSFSGVSVFDTAALGVYAGNRLAPQELLEAEICSMVGREVFDGVRHALPEVLSAVIGDVYNGPVGVDMMAVDNQDYAIAPAVELNLRNTMGHVCLSLYDRYIERGAVGRFAVEKTRRPDSADVYGGRIRRGVFNLVPPGGDLTFCVEVR